MYIKSDAILIFRIQVTANLIDRTGFWLLRLKNGATIPSSI